MHLVADTNQIPLDVGTDAVDSLIKAKQEAFDDRLICCGEKVLPFDDGYICNKCDCVFD